MVDVAQPDVLYLGGIDRTMRVARMAAAHGLPVTPHSANWVWSPSSRCISCPPCPTPASTSSSPSRRPTTIPWQYGLFRNDPYRVSDGRVTISGEPGWGVEIEPEWLARSRYQVSEAP